MTDRNDTTEDTAAGSGPTGGTAPDSHHGRSDPFERVFEHVNDALLVVDVEADRITKCNDRACRLLHYDREDLLSLGPSDIHPHELAAVEAFLETVREEGSAATDGLSCYTSDGEIVPAEIRGSTITVDGTEQVLVSIRDVSMRVRQREKLRRLSAAVEATDDGIALLAPDGTVEFANEAYATLVGADDPTAVVGTAWEDQYGKRERFDLDVRPALTSEGRWLGELTTAPDDGAGRPIEASLTELEDGGLVCVARDLSAERERERQLRRLVDGSRAFMEATDRQGIADATVETVADVVGHEIACLRLYDREANELQRTALTDAAAGVLEEQVAYDLKASTAGRAYRNGESIRNEPGTDAYATETDRADLHVPVGEFGVLTVIARDGFTDREIQLVELLAEGTRTALARTSREQTLRDRTAELERRRAELSATDRVNALVRDLVRTMLGPSVDRSEIERTVCDRLADSDSFDAAWIATVDEEGAVTVERQSVVSDVFPGAEAFVTSPFAHELVRSADADGATAVRRRRFEAPEEGDDTGAVAAATPIACGRHRYGVLAVGAGAREEFGDAVEAGLELLGETLAFAITAEQRQRTLLSRDTVELEFAFTSPFSALSSELDCRCINEGPAEDGAPDATYRIRVTHGEYDAIESFLIDFDTVEDCRLVEARAGECVIEATVEGAPPKLFAESGVNVRSLVAENGEDRLVVETASDPDVSELLASIEADFEDVRLVAKRQARRTSPLEAIAANHDDSLTDRQRSVLETAHEHGYYEWPRDHTAEEVADALDIASPTLHEHLRTAEKALVSAFLEADRDREQ